MSTTAATKPLPKHDSVDELAKAEVCLARFRDHISAGLAYLKEHCTADGVISAARLDDHQQVSYELAFCVAELEAAAVVLQYAQAKATQGDVLCTELALTFCAEQLNNLFHRLLGHGSDAGISRGDMLQLMAEPAIDSFLTDHGSAERYAQIGVALAARGTTQRLPSGLDQEKDLVRESFARFADEVVAPLAQEIHRFDTDIPDDLLQAAAEMGCFGSCIPERFGGLMPDDGHDSLGMLVVTEELSRGSLGAAGSLITRPEIAARALLEGGTEAQKSTYLPRFATGEWLAAISITEPDYGSDVASLSLRATPTEGGWVLNGAKTWCTFAGKADVLVVIARTEPDPSLGHRALSMFLVDKPRFAGHDFCWDNASGGKLTGHAIPTIGYRGMHSFELSFVDLFVPETALVGGAQGRGRGFYLTMAGLSGGRIQTAARATGVMQAALDQAITYTQDRRVFGRAIGDYQLTQVKLGRMYAALTASRQFSYAVARLMDGGGGRMQASLVKLYACRASEWVTREALQIHGGMGYAEESPVSRYFVDARVLSIFEGAEETLALKVVARELISNGTAVLTEPAR